MRTLILTLIVMLQPIVAISDTTRKQDWVKEWSTLDLAKVVARAKEEQKLLFVRVVQHGCYYCELDDEVHFQDPILKPLLDEQVLGVEIQIDGSKKIKTLGGIVLTEQQLAMAWIANYTPTTVIVQPAQNIIFTPLIDQAAERSGSISASDYVKVIEHFK